MSLFSSPLLALDVEVIVKIVLFLLFIGGSLISKLISSLADAQRAKKARRPNPGVRPAAVDREVDEFRRQSPTSRIPNRNPPPAPPKAPNQNQNQNQKQSSKPKKSSSGGGAKKRLVPATTVDQRQEGRDDVSSGRSVADHVQRHLLQGGIGQRSSHLAETIDQADERLEGHLHQMFDHTIGQLNRDASGHIDQGTDASAYDVQGEESPTLAKRIHEMLRQPQTASVAIVLNEVLRRPEERWE